MRGRSLWMAWFLVWTLVFTADLSGQTDPEAQIRQRFPSLHLDSAARFEPGQVHAGGRIVSGLRPRFPAAEVVAKAGEGVAEREEARFGILYPPTYSDLLVAELGAQQVVLRTVGAYGASATGSSGPLTYRRAYESTDVVVVPAENRSEELLLLHDRRAPREFDYEIVSTSGISRAVLDGGAVRFLPDSPAVAPPPDLTPPGSGRFVQPLRTLQIDRPWVLDATGVRSETAARWSLIEVPGAPQILRLTLDAGELKYPLVIDPSFSATGSLITPRELHTATLLTSGKVLIAGGWSGGAPLASAELYDPSTGTFTATVAPLNVARASHTATLMPDGKVMIIGGRGASGALASVEFYDPVFNVFEPSAQGQLIAARSGHMTTRLADGRLLVAGGFSGTSGPALASAEVYDPATGTFTNTGAMVLAHARSAAVLLPDGQVLVAAGVYGYSSYMRNAERYNPATGTFTATGFMPVAQTWHSATLLTNGKVLFAGGDSSNLAVAELYDPSTGAFTTTGSLSTARWAHSATLLPNDKVLIAGGRETSSGSYLGSPLISAQLYDAAAGTFTFSAYLASPRYGHTATLLATGRVLIAGGVGSLGLLSSVELYDYATASSAAGPSLPSAATSERATLVMDGKVLIAGGTDTLCRLYDPATNSFASGARLSTVRRTPRLTLLPSGNVLVSGGNSSGTASVASAEEYVPGIGVNSPPVQLLTARADHTATLLRDGTVLLSGGYWDSSAVGAHQSSAEIVSNGTSVATGSMTTARSEHTATLLPNGKVLVTGGYVAQQNGGGITYPARSSAELYDPESRTFSATGSMAAGRYGHSATLLPNGKVLVAGGWENAVLGSAELFDPASGTFAATGSMTMARTTHTATLLPNGKVLITGGTGSASSSTSAELYDPLTGTFASTAGLLAARFGHMAVLLPTGPSVKVLIAGGYGLTTTDLWSVVDGATGTRSPVVSSQNLGGTLPFVFVLDGTGFQSNLEGSNGTSNSSAASGPVVQLMRIDNEETVYVGSFVKPEFNSTRWAGLLESTSPGLHRVTLYVNGLAAAQKVAYIGRWDPPTQVTATAGSATSVTVTWGVGGATGYEVLRSTSGRNFVPLASVASGVGTHTDTSVTPGTSYLYSVRITGPAGGSVPSSPDLATTVIFTDPSLTVGTTIKAAHLTELRTAATAVARLAGQSDPSYTDPTITPGVTPMKAVHMTELQSALTAALSQLQLSARMWTPAASGSPVTATRIIELRNAAK